MWSEVQFYSIGFVFLNLFRQFFLHCRASTCSLVSRQSYWKTSDNFWCEKCFRNRLDWLTLHQFPEQVLIQLIYFVRLGRTWTGTRSLSSKTSWRTRGWRRTGTSRVRRRDRRRRTDWQREGTSLEKGRLGRGGLWWGERDQRGDWGGSPFSLLSRNKVNPTRRRERIWEVSRIPQISNDDDILL